MPFILKTLKDNFSSGSKKKKILWNKNPAHLRPVDKSVKSIIFSEQIELGHSIYLGQTKSLQFIFGAIEISIKNINNRIVC